MASLLLSSDDEDYYEESTPQLKLDWVDLDAYGFGKDVLCISEMPGCRFKNTWRNLDVDLKVITEAEIKSVYVLMTLKELEKYRQRSLFGWYKTISLDVHHYPIEDGMCPDVNIMKQIIDDLKEQVRQKRKCLIHCHGGFGRACLVVACLLMNLNAKLTAEDVIEHMRQLRGSRAIQTIKQYNFIHDYAEVTRPKTDVKM